MSHEKLRKRINTEEKKVTLSVRRRAPTVLLVTEASVDEKSAEKAVVLKRSKQKL